MLFLSLRLNFILNLLVILLKKVILHKNYVFGHLYSELIPGSTHTEHVLFIS